LNLLQAPISIEQKSELLKLVGYDDDSIKKLLGSNGGSI
jgi:hypothetical protein